ncbi:MAG: ABC transporter ATP-binding protein [Lachnospiraceae bacterium]|nr:ABC transporter ATP-binding protein [Lachnospiraceae bacterium]
MELKLDGIGKRYGKHRALQNVSLIFHPGIYGLIGPNGAGKSTMMNIIAGILKQTEGKVLLDGQEAGKLGKRYRARLGYLPQAVGFYPNFTAVQFLRYMAQIQEMEGTAVIEQRISELLEMVNLSTHANQKIGGFSGGMKQRLGIAQALLHDPDIVIFDEPTAGLDPMERIRFRNLVTRIAVNKIVILATHIVSDVQNLADELLIMQKGSVICRGTIPECLEIVNGRIYSVHIPESELLTFCEQYRVTQIDAKGEDSVVRIVTDEPPKGAMLLESPNLEDLYLYFFGIQQQNGTSEEL